MTPPSNVTKSRTDQCITTNLGPNKLLSAGPFLMLSCAESSMTVPLGLDLTVPSY